MSDQPSNPYSSPAVESGCSSYIRRPIGVMLWAIALFMGGALLGAGGILRFAQNWSIKGPPESLLACLNYLHFGLISLAAIGSAAGLLMGRRWGWWAAIGTCSLLLATFALVPATYSIFHGNTPRLRNAIWGVAMVLYWLYLHKSTVQTYFSLSRRRWACEVGLLMSSLVAVFSFVELFEERW